MDKAKSSTAKLILFFLNTIDEAKENQFILEENLTIFNTTSIQKNFLKRRNRSYSFFNCLILFHKIDV